MANIDQDKEEIKNLINTQFECVKWGNGQKLDRDTFHCLFLNDANLFPAKRPVNSQTPEEFLKRMEKLEMDGVLSSFHETGKGMHICVIGNIAIAMAGCIMTENEKDQTYDISVFLLLKENEHWKIAAQAWDLVDDITQAFLINSLELEATK
jgi:hypothetical protein